MLSIITKFAWESGGKPFQLCERSLDLSNEKRIEEEKTHMYVKYETRNKKWSKQMSPDQK